MFVGEPLEWLDITRIAPQMDSQNCRRAWRNAAANGISIQGMCIRVDVGEDRSDANPFQRVSGCNVGEGRQDDFTGQDAGFCHDLQGHRAVADGDAVRGTGDVADFRFELFDKRTIVREPAAGEYLLNAFQHV